MKVKKNKSNSKRVYKDKDNKSSNVNVKKISTKSKVKPIKNKQRDNERQAKRVRNLQLLEANEDEDKEIRKLEKVLKLKRRRKSKDSKKSPKAKLPSAFFDDGLVYVLEVLDKKKDDLDAELSDCEQPDTEDIIETIFSDRKRPTKNESRSKRPQVGAKKPRKLIDLLDSKSQKPDSDSESRLSGSDIDSGNEDHPSDNDITDDKSVDSNNEEKPDENAKEPDIWEDIYGRKRDKEGNIMKTNDSVYVPPSKRLKPICIDEQKKAELLRIRRHLKGLLNRLSEANMKPIATQIEDMYMKYSRNDMNESLLSLLEELVLGSEQIPPRLMLDQAMLIALLHANVGSEVGAFFLQSASVKLNELLQSSKNYGLGKQCNNLLMFISHLYNFKVTQSIIMFDILKRLIDSFQDKDIELIQLLLKNIGFSLRKDNPLRLKEIIHSIQAKAPTFESKDGSRVQFMLDTLTAIRNNNMYKISDYDPSIVEHTRKLLRGFVRPGSSIQELVISFEDLLNAEERGRWWIVGSAWSERDNPASSSLANTSMTLPKSDFSEKILELARKQRMNTEIRRTIFCIIMTAEDFMDAFEKLLKLNLKNQQEREIINVLLHCVLSEKKSNPYYAYLAGKFCKCARKYHMNLQFALWDKFKELGNFKPNQIVNLANFLIHLFTKGDMPISILKVIQFSEMDKTMLRFFRKVLLGILLHESDEVCSNVFQRIVPAKNLSLLKEGLRLFMHHFLKGDKRKFDLQVYLKLSERIKGVECILNSEKNAFKL